MGPPGRQRFVVANRNSLADLVLEFEPCGLELLSSIGSLTRHVPLELLIVSAGIFPSMKADEKGSFEE